MNPLRMVSIILIVAGGLALAYGSFTYTKDSHDLNVGPVQLSVKDKETVNIPQWAGVAAIAVGALMLAFGGKQR